MYKNDKIEGSYNFQLSSLMSNSCIIMMYKVSDKTCMAYKGGKGETFFVEGIKETLVKSNKRNLAYN